jgi:hypothetical protein
MANSGTLARRLSDGLYGKLEFDFSCERGHYFGEAYLHGVIMEILASNTDPKKINVRPSFAIDAIQKYVADEDGNMVRQRGTREVDFAVIDRVSATETADLHYCLEVKWAGSSHATPVNVLKDLTRLALVSEANESAECLFLLAGRRVDVEKLVEQDLPAISKRLGKAPLKLKHASGPRMYNLRNAARQDGWLDVKHLGILLETFTSVPDQIETFMYKPRHDTSTKWNVRVWRVRTSRHRLGAGQGSTDL